MGSKVRETFIFNSRNRVFERSFKTDVCLPNRCFRIPSQGSAWLERGRESRLLINNVTYDFQGEYECRASNFINGQERSATSDPISLQVVGAPQVLHPLNSSGYEVKVKRGESASLTLVVCADPRPRHVGEMT